MRVAGYSDLVRLALAGDVVRVLFATGGGGSFVVQRVTLEFVMG